ncbi:MAG: hypothetical protein V9F00_04750 [Nocardioides sp.]
MNPLRGVPVSDYVRDGAAAVCLLACLSMPWDFNGDGWDRWWVAVAVLSSLLSLALPYIGAAQIIPGWSKVHIRIIKAAALVPFVSSVLAALVNELVHVNSDFEGGFGSGIAIGLAGALLAVQPRFHDEDLGGAQDQLWRGLYSLLAISSIVAMGASYLAFLLQYVRAEFGVDSLVIVRTTMALGLVALVWFFPTVPTLSGAQPWRRIVVVVGFTWLAVALLTGDGNGLFLESRVAKWDYPLSGLFLVGGAAALVVSHPMQRSDRTGTHPFHLWIGTAKVALGVSAAGLVVLIVGMVLTMIDEEDFSTVKIVISALAAIPALLHLTAVSLLADVQNRRRLALGLIGLAVVLAVIILSVGSSEADLAVGGPETAVWITLPCLAVYALTVPKVIRDHLGPLVPQTTPSQPHQHPGYQDGT